MKRFLHTNLVFLLFVLLGIVVSYAYYSHALEESHEATIREYRKDHELAAGRLINEIDHQQIILATIKRYLEVETSHSTKRLTAFAKHYLEDDVLQDICLIIPGDDIFYSVLKEANDVTCEQFDLLVQDKLFDIGKAPKLLISDYIVDAGKPMHIAVILALDSLAKQEVKNFDQYLMLFDIADMSSRFYQIVADGLLKTDQMTLSSAVEHTYTSLGEYHDAELVFLSQINQDGIQANVPNGILLTSLLMFAFLSLIGFYLRVFVRDRAFLQQAVQEKARELDHSEAFRELILSNNPDYIFVKDSQYRITYANDNFKAIYPAHMQDKIIGYTTLEEYLPEQAEAFLEMDRIAFEQGSSETVESINFPDGEHRILSTKKQRFINLNGEPNIIGIARDVTERETMLQQLAQSNDELKQFAYRTSHDLKAPLVTINRMVNYIKQDITQQNIEEALNNLDVVANQSQKLSNLVSDILALTKAEQQDTVPEPILFETIIEDVISRHQKAIQDHGLLVRKMVDKDIKFHSEKVRVTQILENLISNAVKYYDPSKIESWINIEVSNTTRDIEIQVSDNGVGIPENEQDNIFKLFTRFHPNLAEGSGIGLSIVKKHIDKLNGKILVDVDDEFTRMIVRLPK